MNIPLIRENFPAELRTLPIWLLWKEVREAGDDKPRKVPFYADGRPRHGNLDSLEDRQNLVDFETAARAYRPSFTGLGVALGPVPEHDTIVAGIDLDGIDPQTDERAQMVMGASGSFAEVSPSGRGLHILGTIPEPQPAYKLNGLEIYAGGRYFTVTGRRLNNAGVEDISDAIVLAKELFPKSQQPKPNGAAHLNGGTIVEGNRHNAAIARVGQLAGRLKTYAELLGAMRAWNETTCNPPLDDAELISIVQYGWEKTGELPMAPTAQAAEEAGVVSKTDMHASQRLIERHGQNIRFTVERAWLVWDSTRWRQDEKAVMITALAKESARSFYQDIRGAANEKEALQIARAYQQRRSIEAAIALARDDVPTKLVNFDANPWLLNVRNGTVDLKDGEIRPHRKEDLCTLIAGTDFDPSGTCPRWTSFIGEICLEDIELIDYLQRMCGYLLTASVREQCLFFLHGGGSNGKTTFVETIMRVMGEYACSAETEMLMVKKHGGIPNDVARLRGVRAVFLNETNQGSRFDEAKLKNLCGSDTLTARFLREEFFDFRPTHKLMLRGNHKPTVNGTDEGIWRRMRLIPFDLRLEESDRDHELEERLSSELPGILRWMVDGCLLWQREGLRTPAKVLQALQEYRSESDTLQRFIDEQCECAPLYDYKCSALYSRYREFCELAGERYVSSKDFPVEMERKGFKRHKKVGERMFLGIRMKPSVFQSDERYN